MSREKQFTIQESKTPVSQTSNSRIKKFSITKRIAKHGRQAVIVIPSVLSEFLQPNMLVSITISVLNETREIE